MGSAPDSCGRPVRDHLDQLRGLIVDIYGPTLIRTAIDVNECVDNIDLAPA
jgi:hypothetical protein